MWRPDFPFLEQRPARLHGWGRRFWQGSHDHRGVPDAPGRVVTLIENAAEHTDGVAFRLPANDRAELLQVLDHREKNGYARLYAPVELRRNAPVELQPNRCAPPAKDDSHGQSTVVVSCLIYVAAVDNRAFLGPAPLAEIVRQIATSSGPSGRNVDYLFELADALRKRNIEDRHVFELEAHARQLMTATASTS